MAAHSKPIKFQDDMCMCADKNKPNQTTVAFSKLHGLCFKAGFKLSFMQHLIGGFSRFFFCPAVIIILEYKRSPFSSGSLSSESFPLTHTEIRAAIVTASHNLTFQIR